MTHGPGMPGRGGDAAADASPDETVAGFAALRGGVAWGAGLPRSTLAARGPDAVRFVDGFTTAAVAAVACGAGVEGFFTDARGWVICLANILRTDDGLRIDLPAGMAARLHAHLEHYHIRERVELADETAAWSHLVVAGPAAGAWLAAHVEGPLPEAILHHRAAMIAGVPVEIVRIDSYGPMGFLLRLAATDLATLSARFEADAIAVPAAAAVWQAARIEAGMPDTEDVTEKTLPQELCRDERAISFTKGCYLGQETVARIDAVGHVNRRFVTVAIQCPVSPPAAVEVEGEVAGMLTSICRSPTLGCGLGLGLLQTKLIDSGRPLTVSGRPASVVALPLVPPPLGTTSDTPDVVPAVPYHPEGELLLKATRFDVIRIGESGGLRSRDVIRHPGSVVIVPLVSREEVCLVEVVRVAVGATLLELPAGTLDRVESLEEAARRELAEETGYRAGRMTPLVSMWMSPGILRERMHVFVAEDLVPGPQALEPGEQIRIRPVGWAEALAMCFDGRIEDAKTIAALLMVEARR
ncbi:MAG: NUDIX domain-containing protein [Planctomycetia bacterium]